MRPKSFLLLVLLRFRIQELRQDARDATLCVFSDKRENTSSELSPFKQFGDFNGLAGSSSTAPGGATSSVPPCCVR